MNPDDERLMAYADGELDPLSAKRVERAMAADPALAHAVEAHRALRRRLDAAFAPVLSDPVPDRLSAMLHPTVLPMPSRSARPSLGWRGGLSLAASLLIGIVLGTQWQGGPGPVASGTRGLVASGDLAGALETRLASAAGDTRILASFREEDGQYCRVFAAPSLDGIACRVGKEWQLRRTQSSPARRDAAYRQATSGDAAILAAAQDMMIGDPLDEAGERAARAAGWRQ